VPCLARGVFNDVQTEFTHIRFADASLAKPESGGLRPDDYWTLPQCSKHHREQTDFGDEREWWRLVGVDAPKLALRLWSLTGDYEAATEAIKAALRFQR
jgi:hypothetical protein